MSKILVIDDEAWLREMIRCSRWQQRGFEVIEAFPTATRGITPRRGRSCRTSSSCDVNMAKAGRATRRWRNLREEPTTASIPFILMTGLAGRGGDVRSWHGVGSADDYLPKPFKIDELYAAVDARLRKVRTVREEVERKFS